MQESGAMLAEEGKRLFFDIMAHHTNLSEFYKSPDLVENMTTSPKVMISVPMEDWDALTARERDLLAAYAASLVKVVRDNPLEYARVPSHLPAAPQIRLNSARMSDGSWQIMAGPLTPDGRNIVMGVIVSSGNNTRC